MRMLVTVEFADAGVKTGTHRVLVVGGCSDMAAPGDIGMSLEEAKTLLSALQWEFVAAQAAEITERARQCKRCGARLNIKLGTTKCSYALRKGPSAKSSSCIVPL